MAHGIFTGNQLCPVSQLRQSPKSRQPPSPHSATPLLLAGFKIPLRLSRLIPPLTEARKEPAASLYAALPCAICMARVPLLKHYDMEETAKGGDTELTEKVLVLVTLISSRPHLGTTKQKETELL